MSKRLPAMLGFTVLVACLFAFTYTHVLASFRAEGQRKKGEYLFKLGQDVDDGVEVKASLVGLDPGKGDLTVRLEFEPFGAYWDSDNSVLREPITVGVNSASGRAEYAFRAKEAMGPVEFTTNLKGSAMDYPFDHQTGEIYVTVSKPEYEGKPGKDTLPESYEPVPIMVTGTARVGGFSLTKIGNADAQEEDEETGKQKKVSQPDHGPGFFMVTIESQRSKTVVQFALLIMTLQWLLALSAYLVATVVVIGGRKAELPFFAWMAALLFALPPLRNVMVGAPPIGIYSDYLAFLWCEGIVALCLVSIVLTWVIRKPS